MSQKKIKISAEQLKSALRSMMLIRFFEQKCGQLYGLGKIFGFCHLYIGQEAVATAVDLVRKEGDSMITAYRDHGHALLCKLDPKYVFAELMGKASGPSMGKGGSMHIFNKKDGFYGGHGIVGAQVALGTGIAFKYKYCNENNIAYTFFGDGASNQGQVFESFNMASNWSLPVVYILENNGYAISTPISRATSSNIQLYKRGEAFGLDCYQIDGMEIDTLYVKFSEISKKVRETNKPCLIEVLTYRYRGHSMSDPAQYRTKAEVEENKQRDPIEYAKNLLLNLGYASEKEIKDMESSVKSIIRESANYAEKDNYPDTSLLKQHVFLE